MSHPAMTSDAGIFLWMTYQAMQKAGLDTAAIFSSVNLPDEPPDTSVRRNNSTQRRFWDAAERISGDPDIGLTIGGLMPPFRGQVLEYLFLSSPTFGEGIMRAMRYHRLLTDALKFELRIDGDTAILTGFDHPVRHYQECAFAIFLQFFRYISEGAFAPSEVWLHYEHGADAARYIEVYGCPVLLGMPESSVRFAAHQLERVSPAAEPKLLLMHEVVAKQYLGDLEKRELIYQVERELGGLLEERQATLEMVAAKLDKSARTLRSDLQQIGTNFNDVVAAYRERLSRRLLSRTQLPLDQIIYLTGFSEPSAFTRAFKRWTGETPTDYRHRKQNSNEVD
ncbi:AraC family transcriptional regulator [Aquirhabdus parva]|uniref:AraC family transcriptional regulator n=1 Tax=Aquirhabdus parva TaxID=2283318 RepID=A0A345P8V2_9GAMM|nr:AraC family transcriptional regulator [Aquirhabdus parva]AXI03711.1 AraC family transcriptional regulator [Aquirhabdus parva]